MFVEFLNRPQLFHQCCLLTCTYRDANFSYNECSATPICMPGGGFCSYASRWTWLKLSDCFDRQDQDRAYSLCRKTPRRNVLGHSLIRDPYHVSCFFDRHII